jgi:hypothetical protein
MSAPHCDLAAPWRASARWLSRPPCTPLLQPYIVLHSSFIAAIKLCYRRRHHPPKCTRKFIRQAGNFWPIKERSSHNTAKHLTSSACAGGRYEVMPFHPYYLKSLERYAALRFMDMQGTNHRADQTWSERVLPSHRSFQDAAPIEHMLLLANVLGADPWFCMPHAANDDYVRQFATLALRTLRDDVVIYIEYSNEVFNPRVPLPPPPPPTQKFALGSIACCSLNACPSAAQSRFVLFQLHYCPCTVAACTVPVPFHSPPTSH